MISEINSLEPLKKHNTLLFFNPLNNFNLLLNFKHFDDK